MPVLHLPCRIVSDIMAILNNPSFGVSSVSPATTINHLLVEGEALFQRHALCFGHGTIDAWDEAVFLLAHALNLGPMPDRSVLEVTVDNAAAAAVRALFKRRIDERIPAAYLTEKAWFCGLPMFVDQRVLVPRSPIAQLITERFHPWLASPPSDILDLCTGSGCIGIACAYAFPEARVLLSDICEQALAVARINIQQHQCHQRVELLQSDLFGGLNDQQFDLIVSNPPYVDATDFADMPDEYRHEPRLGLVSGDDGLDFTRRLLAQAKTYLRPGGALIVEVGNSALALERAFPRMPFTWLEFSDGDSGVFFLTREELFKSCQPAG